MKLRNQSLFETPFQVMRDSNANSHVNLEDERKWLFEIPSAFYEVDFEGAMPSCEPGRFKSGKLDVVRWGERIPPGKGSIPKHLKLAILTRGRIRLPVENVKWLIDANKRQNDWVNRLPNNLRELVPEVDVTIELFMVRTTLSPTEAKGIFLQYLVQRHNQELQNCHKLFLADWRAAFFKAQLEDLLKANLEKLFREAKVPLPENMREVDKGIFVLLSYVSFPNQLEKYLKSPIKEPISPHRQCGTISPGLADASSAQLIPSKAVKLAASWNSCTLEAPTNFGNYTLKRGQTWKDAEGNVRTIITIRTDFIYYITQNNRGWQQNHRGFIVDILYTPFVEAGIKSSPLQELAKTEIAFLLGVVSTIHLSGFVAATGLSIVEFITIRREDIQQGIHAVEIIRKARAVLKKYAPNLYEVLYRAIIREILYDIPENTTAENLASYLGKLVGIVIGKQFRTARRQLWDISRALAFTAKLAVSSAIRAGKANLRDVQLAAKHIQTTFKERGVIVTLVEAEKIVREYAKSEELVKAALQDLERALQKIFSIYNKKS